MERWRDREINRRQSEVESQRESDKERMINVQFC